LLGHAHRAKTGLFQPVDRLIRQLALAFALQGGLGDFGKDGAKALGQGFVVGAGGQVVRQSVLAHGCFLFGVMAKPGSAALPVMF
jgi:hypothetical protein